MADDEKKTGRVDGFFDKIAHYIGTGIQRFVSFLFFLFTAGAVFGYWVAISGNPFDEYFILAPAIMGIVAYYNRTAAILLFIILIVVMFIL